MHVGWCVYLTLIPVNQKPTRLFGMCLGFILKEFYGEIRGTWDEALECVFLSVTFAIRVFVVRGDRVASLTEINGGVIVVLVEHGLSFHDCVDNLVSKCVKLGIQVNEIRRHGIGPNLDPSVSFVLRGLPSMFIRFDEHTTWRRSCQLFDNLMTSRMTLSAAWGQRIHFTFNFKRAKSRKMSQNFRQLKPKVFVSRATAKIFRGLFVFQSLHSYVGAKPKQPLPDLRRRRGTRLDRVFDQPSAWQCERRSEDAIKKQISSLQGCLFGCH